MFNFTKWIAAPALALGLICTADSSSAEAQTFCTTTGCYSTGGGFGLGYGTTRSSYRPLYGNAFRSPSIQRWGSHYRNGGSIHRGHYDWHPTEVYRHRNHVHVKPGHYDYHRGRH